MTAEQIQQADIRLAYVQHPFPVQGATSDTAHLIAAEHSTRQGSYVAITRARDSTHIYANQPAPDSDAHQPSAATLAAALGRYEPEIPSISAPLTYEHAVTAKLSAETPAASFSERHRQTRLKRTSELELPADRSDDRGWGP